MKHGWRLCLVVLFAFFGVALAQANAPSARDLPPGLQIPDAARPGPAFDV